MNETPHPTSDAVRERAAEIVAGRDYHLRDGSSDGEWLYLLLLEIINWILIPFRWLFQLTEGLPDVLRWTIVMGLAVILALLIGHITYTLVTAIRGKKSIQNPGWESRRKAMDPAEFERLAGEAKGRADYITAVRFLFRASVLRLEVAEKKAHRPGTTNRELLRRYRSQPRLTELLKLFVETIDRKWYGDESCSLEEYSKCEAAHGDVCRLIQENAHVLRA